MTAERDGRARARPPKGMRHDRARSIAEALGNSYRSGQWWRCRCPVHNSTGATLALRSVGGGLQVRCFARCSSAAILAELHRRGLIDKAASCSRSRSCRAKREADARDRAKRIAAARWIWDETEPANWLIETYLGGRLILCPIPETIRLHRSLYHREAGCRRPAMVARSSTRSTASSASIAPIWRRTARARPRRSSRSSGSSARLGAAP